MSLYPCSESALHIEDRSSLTTDVRNHAPARRGEVVTTTFFDKPTSFPELHEGLRNLFRVGDGMVDEVGVLDYLLQRMG